MRKRHAAFAVAAVGLATLALPLLAIAALAGLGPAATSPQPPVTGGPSSAALADIPPRFLALYEAAAAHYRLDWAILAAIGKVECDHGRDPDPSCTRHGALNYAGAGGPAQFLIATWRQYGVDGDGDGTADMWDPNDAIFGMANYLSHSGAPSDYRRAIFEYNHADWYVARVLAIAARYRAAASAGAPPAAGPPGVAGGVVRVPRAGQWLAPLPGTGLLCDARIIADVRWLLATYGLRASACYAAHGHARSGEHPLGLALDAVPSDGNWSRTLALAQAFGWRAQCGASGCAGALREPMRFIGYNGYPGHGDPAHAGADAHIHLSWRHALAPPFTQAAWVDVFEVSGQL